MVSDLQAGSMGGDPAVTQLHWAFLVPAGGTVRLGADDV